MNGCVRIHYEKKFIAEMEDIEERTLSEDINFILVKQPPTCSKYPQKYIFKWKDNYVVEKSTAKEYDSVTNQVYFTTLFEGICYLYYLREIIDCNITCSIFEESLKGGNSCSPKTPFSFMSLDGKEIEIPQDMNFLSFYDLCERYEESKFGPKEVQNFLENGSF